MNCLSLVALVIVLVIAGGSVLASGVKTSNELNVAGRTAVAKVNGQAIYEDQVAPFFEQEAKKYKKYGARKISPDKMHYLRRKALIKVIEQEAIRQESAKITVPDMDRKIAEQMKEVKSKYSSDSEFADMLHKKQMTEKGLQTILKQRLSLQAYMEQHELVNPGIPEEDIRAYYESNPRAFSREELVKVSHIMIKTDTNAGAEEKELARKKTEDIRKEIIAGKDFIEVAKKQSQDGYAQKGGDLGFIKRGFMPGEFDEAAFSLQVGQVSDVVSTKYGFHIIKLYDRKAAGKIPYPEVKDFITKYLRDKKEKKRLKDHIEELRGKAKVEILSDEYKEKLQNPE